MTKYRLEANAALRDADDAPGREMEVDRLITRRTTWEYQPTH